MDILPTGLSRSRQAHLFQLPPPEGCVVAGSSLDETYSGTYSVDPNCTGSFTVLVEPDTRTSTVNLVWTENTNGASAVFTTPGFTLTAVARRINPRETD